MARAKTPTQRQHIIDRLLQVWEANPGLRLGELINVSLDGHSLAERDRDLFYTDDTHLIEKIERVHGLKRTKIDGWHVS